MSADLGDGTDPSPVALGPSTKFPSTDTQKIMGTPGPHLRGWGSGVRCRESNREGGGAHRATSQMPQVPLRDVRFQQKVCQSRADCTVGSEVTFQPIQAEKESSVKAL